MPRPNKVLPKPKAVPKPPLQEVPEAEVQAVQGAVLARQEAVQDVEAENLEIEEQMVNVAIEESRGSPTLAELEADYDKLPDLEEYTPAMEKEVLPTGTSVRMTGFVQHLSFNNAQGTIIRREPDDAGDEQRGYRYHVRLRGLSEGFELRWVKRINLIVLKKPDSPAPAPGEL